MVKKGERVGVALSGGKDSTTLLYLLKPLADEMKFELIAISVDEGIRGYRDKTLAYARAACKKLGVKLVVKSFKKEIGITMDEIARKKRGERETLCTYCGVFRRWILNKTARELKLDKLAVGHNLDDFVQTLFMNILRNEPFRLARFGPVGGMVEDEGFVPRIKPLFRAPEEEIALYAKLKGIGTGKKTCCPNVYEAFRRRVRIFLNEMEADFPGTKVRALNSFMRIRKSLGKEYAHRRKEKIGRCARCGEPSSARVCKRCGLIEELKMVLAQAFW